MQSAYAASLSRACRLVQISRSLCAYRSRRPDQELLRHRMREVAQARPRYGYRRVHVLLRREGWHVNMKRVRRLYRLEGLQLRHRVRRRKHASLHRGVPPAASRAHERWSMDFVHDAAHRRQSVSGADGGRSMESLESDPGGGSKHVRAGGRGSARSSDRPSTASHGRSLSITARSSPRECSMSGRTSEGFYRTSSAQESQSKTALSNPSTASCAMNV